MKNVELTADWTVEDVLDRWPGTAVVFRKYADACVGCNLAAFCTLKDVSKEYDVDLNLLMNDLFAAIENL